MRAVIRVETDEFSVSIVADFATKLEAIEEARFQAVSDMESYEDGGEDIGMYEVLPKGDAFTVCEDGVSVGTYYAVVEL